jgi:hypothetical protein
MYPAMELSVHVDCVGRMRLGLSPKQKTVGFRQEISSLFMSVVHNKSDGGYMKILTVEPIAPERTYWPVSKISAAAAASFTPGSNEEMRAASISLAKHFSIQKTQTQEEESSIDHRRRVGVD